MLWIPAIPDPDDHRIVSHDAPRFMLYYHCLHDISWSLHFSTRVMSIAVLDVYGFQTCLVQQLLLLRYWVSWLSLCFKEEFQLYFEGLHVFHCFVENYLCARLKLQTLGNWKVHYENRNRDWSKKWLQQNSCYAVQVIAKGGFISESCSKELNLQLQLQVKFNLLMQ